MLTEDSLYTILSFVTGKERRNVKRVSKQFREIVKRIRLWSYVPIFKYQGVEDYMYLEEIKPKKTIAFFKEYSKNGNRCSKCGHNVYFDSAYYNSNSCFMCSASWRYQEVCPSLLHLFRVVDNYIDTNYSMGVHVEMWRCRACKKILYYSQAEGVGVLHSLLVTHIRTDHRLTYVSLINTLSYKQFYYESAYVLVGATLPVNRQYAHSFRQ